MNVLFFLLFNISCLNHKMKKPRTKRGFPYNSLRQMIIPPELSQKRRLVHLMHEGCTFRVLSPSC